MKHSRRVTVLVTLFTLGALSGCVYLRLLEIKKQLKYFDENIAVSGRPDLVIEFKKPLLKTADVKFLIGAEPLDKKEDGELIYHYEFDMVFSTAPAALPPLHKLTLRLAFKDGKLTKIIIPETFMLLFPREMLVETMRQAADAQVYETKRLARAKIKLDPRDERDLPSRSRALFLLGEPAEEREEKAPQKGDPPLRTLVYNYSITRAQRKVPISGRLSFDESGLLHKVRVKWDTSQVEADYLRE